MIRLVAGITSVVVVASLAAMAGAPHRPQPTTGAGRVATFPLSRIKLLDGPFKRSEALNVAYVHALEVDRLLAPFRTEAGLTAKAEPYPNWESTGLQGHTAGHYLTALAQAWASTGDAEAKRRLDVMVGELAECQRAHGNGYVGAVPKSRELWAGVAAGTLKVERFGLNGAWVPWYNLHKLFAGLRDAHVIGGSSQAREVLVALATWCANLVATLSDAQIQEMLGAEHGGMNEVLADVFALTGERKYLELAQRFSHKALLDPLTRHEDPLTGLHANTQIPKVVGYGRIAELGGDPAGRDAAAFFWDTVVHRRSVALGGNSVREHFNAADDFAPMLESREGPETCNTYNMLRLTELLFRGQPLAEYADYYERSLYNHILSTQHPEHGGYVYFTPIRPRHYRVYSQPKECFWCCVGTGMENHGKHGQFVYAHRGDELFVNLFVASELTWPERGLTLRQDTTFPDEPRTRLVLTLEQPRQFTLQVRHPAWVAADAFRLRVNGQPVATRSTPSSYVAIDRTWRAGDRVEVELPMRTRLERLPDGSDYAAVMHGPILLAARTGTEQLDGLVAGSGRMAHTSTGPYLALDAAPMLVGELAALPDRIQPVAGRPLTFRAPTIIRPAASRDLELEPFFRVHDSRYMIYWRVATPDAYERVVTELRDAERTRLRLETRTLDRVVPGEQQSEIDHGVRSEASSTGATHGRPYREATGSFGYELKRGKASGPLQLIVTYLAGDRGRRFEIRVDDRPVATVTLDGRKPDRFTDTAYPIPADILAADADGVLAVRFVAQPGSRAGAVYDIRLARPE
ncbi:MAG: glycoside hydrolase family 127 protein [Vicinamibacteraceae bacterium]